MRLAKDRNELVRVSAYFAFKINIVLYGIKRGNSRIKYIDKDTAFVVESNLIKGSNLRLEFAFVVSSIRWRHPAL